MIRKLLATGLASLPFVFLPAVADSGESTTLKTIMQGLRYDLATITDGLMTDDLRLVARGAARIASHPRIPAPQVERVARELGPEMAAFKQFDSNVHDLSLAIKDAAEWSDRDAMISGYLQLVQGCLACHAGYKERVAAVLAADAGGDSGSKASD